MNTRLEYKTFPFEIKARDGGDGSELKGEGACYCNIDAMQDIYAPGAFDDYLAFFAAEGVIRDEHRVTTGRITAAKSTPTGLYFEGKISATDAGRNQMILVKDGVIKRSSVGACNSGKWLEGPEEIKAWWDSVGYAPTDQDLIRSAYGARLITRSKPYEISTTWRPANERTTIQSKSGPRARPTFDEHSASVLDTLEELLTRAEAIGTIRAKDGRNLAPKSLAQLRRVHDRLNALLSATSPPAGEVAEIDLDIYDRFLSMGERLRGAD